MAKSFHCDYCGEAVSSDAVRCPRCGRFFRAVRCPVCSYTGEGREFAKGCPVCGYLAERTGGKNEELPKKRKKTFNLSRSAAIAAMALLAVLLLYFFYLLIKT